MSDKVLSIDINIEALEVVFKRLSDLEEKLSKITNTKTDNKSMRKLNSELTRTQKLLDKANAGFGRLHGTMKLIAITGGKIFGFLGAMGILTGGIGTVLGLMKYGRTGIDRQNRATRLGASPATLKGIEIASEKYYGTGNKQVMETQSANLYDNVRDTNKGGEFARLGLNQSNLAELPIQEALMQVYDAIQKKKTENVPIAIIKEAMAGIGIDPNYFQVIAEHGSGRGKNNNYDIDTNFNKGYKEYSSVDNQKLIDYETTILDLSNKVEAIFQKLAGNIAPHITSLLKQLEPLIDKWSDELGDWLNSISAEDIEKATKGIIGAITSMVEFIKDSYENLKNPKKGLDKTAWSINEKLYGEKGAYEKAKKYTVNASKGKANIKFTEEDIKGLPKEIQRRMIMEEGSELAGYFAKIGMRDKLSEKETEGAIFTYNQSQANAIQDTKKVVQNNTGASALLKAGADNSKKEIGATSDKSILPNTDMGSLSKQEAYKGLELSAKIPINVYVNMDKDGRVKNSNQSIDTILKTDGTASSYRQLGAR